MTTNEKLPSFSLEGGHDTKRWRRGDGTAYGDSEAYTKEEGFISHSSDQNGDILRSDSPIPKEHGTDPTFTELIGSKKDDDVFGGGLEMPDSAQVFRVVSELHVLKTM